MRLSRLHIAFCVLVLSLSACTGSKYNMLKTLPTTESKLDLGTATRPTIEVGDELCIAISALNEESVKFFRPSRWREGATGIECLYYQVSADGTIVMPILGSLDVLGLSLEEAEVKIAKALEHLLKEPHVRIEYVNFEISLMGEVENPGQYQFPDGRVTILEAIARAGGITQFGKRGTVIVIRETDSGIKHIRLDMRDDAVLSSEYYYLHHQDLVMIDSNPARVANAHNVSTFGSVVVGIGTIAAIILSR